MTLERRNGSVHIVLAERRRSPEVAEAESMQRLRHELRQRLLEVDHDQAGLVMRHLVFVHDTLGRQGWRGVQALESRVLDRAIVQLQMLNEREPSARLKRLADKLMLMRAGAQAREERLRAGPVAVGAGLGDSVQISEVSAEEFEASEREWAATNTGELTELPPDATTPAR